MSENQNLLDQLKELLRRKRSEQWYADKLGITVDEVKELKRTKRKKIYDGGKVFKHRN
ncbi:MAG: hypothetical protein CM15mV19_1350 [uncultured marine virus]|nr:MAG: hypothetical protein CM15mV19_1350 [uncultured marine virus]